MSEERGVCATRELLPCLWGTGSRSVSTVCHLGDACTEWELLSQHGDGQFVLGLVSQSQAWDTRLNGELRSPAQRCVPQGCWAALLGPCSAPFAVSPCVFADSPVRRAPGCILPAAPRSGTGHFASGAATPCAPQAQGQGREASSIPPRAGCAEPGRAVVPSPVPSHPLHPRPAPCRCPSGRAGPGRAPRTAGGGRGGGGRPGLRVSQ